MKRAIIFLVAHAARSQPLPPMKDEQTFVLKGPAAQAREDGLKAHVKPLSVNVPVGDEATAVQWVATTTLLLTLTIWEPGGGVAPGGVGGPGGGDAYAAGRLPDAIGGSMRAPTLLRSSSDLRSTDEWAEVEDVNASSSSDAPARHISTVHRRTLNTAWGRPSATDDQ